MNRLFLYTHAGVLYFISSDSGFCSGSTALPLAGD